MLQRLLEAQVFSIYLSADKKAVWFTELADMSFSMAFDYREFGELIHELELIRRQMVLMPPTPEELDEDPFFFAGMD